MTSPTLSTFFPYGAPELMENHQRYLVRGLLIATLLHGVVLSTFLVTSHFVAAEQPAVRRKVVIIEGIRLPPSLIRPIRFILKLRARPIRKVRY